MEGQGLKTFFLRITALEFPQVTASSGILISSGLWEVYLIPSPHPTLSPNMRMPLYTLFGFSILFTILNSWYCQWSGSSAPRCNSLECFLSSCWSPDQFTFLTVCYQSWWNLHTWCTYDSVKCVWLYEHLLYASFSSPNFKVHLWLLYVGQIICLVFTRLQYNTALQVEIGNTRN